MKDTKIMLGAVLAFLITWFLVALICYAIGSYSFRDSFTCPGAIIIMLVCGWMPAIVVGRDLHDRYYSQQQPIASSDNTNQRPQNRLRAV